jgi:serine protease
MKIIKMMTRRLNQLIFIVLIISTLAICTGNTSALDTMLTDNTTMSIIADKTYQINNVDFNIKELNNINKIKPDKQYVPDEIIVKFKKDKEPFRVIKVPEGKVGEKIKEYLTRSDVDYAEPNYLVYALMIPNDSYYPLQWHMYNSVYGGIHVDEAWNISTGYGVTVAVIDTGISRLGQDLINTRFVPGYDFENGDANPADDNGHGTHVAGTIAQSTNNGRGVAGVAFNSNLMPVKVLDQHGSGTTANVALGIRYAADNGAKVASLSLGGPDDTTLRDAVIYAYNKGVTVVAAAGNDNSSEISYPAAYNDYVIAVGATRYDETRAYYSNYGTGLDVVAPGGDMTVDQNNDGYVDGVLQETFQGNPHVYNNWGYYFFQGTSMATPHVSGVAALLISKGNARTPDEVRTIIQETADDLGTPGRDDTYGWGLVNASRAVNAPYRYRYIHTIEGGNTHNLGENINDTVTISSGTFAGSKMEFNWIRPNNSIALTSVAPLMLNRYNKEYIPDVLGTTWRINVTELDSSNNQVNNINNPNQTYFTVIPAPEFSTLGLVLPLFLAGIFYTQLKRKICNI